METIAWIHRKNPGEGKSIRGVARELGISRNTVRKKNHQPHKARPPLPRSCWSGRSGSVRYPAGRHPFCTWHLLAGLDDGTINTDMADVEFTDNSLNARLSTPERAHLRRGLKTRLLAEALRCGCATASIRETSCTPMQIRSCLFVDTLDRLRVDMPRCDKKNRPWQIDLWVAAIVVQGLLIRWPGG